MKVAVVGDIGIDYYENFKLTKPGGIAFNFAYNLKKTGVENVSLVGALGNDIFSKKLASLLKKLSINVFSLQKLSGNTPKQNIFLKNGERKFTGYAPGVLKKWKLRKKDLAFIEKHDALFIPLSDGMKQIFNAVKKIEGPVKVVDFSQDSEYADFDKKENIVTKNSKYFDVVFTGGKKKHKKMISKLAKKHPEKVFVLTMGKEGSVAFNGGKEFIQKPKKMKVIDTTGAGDAFQAGFLYSWLTKTNIKTALAKGTNRAAVIIKEIGSTPLILR